MKGCVPIKMGIGSSVIPRNLMHKANTEEDFEEILNTTNDCDSNPEDGEKCPNNECCRKFPQDSSSRMEIQAESSITEKT